LPCCSLLYGSFSGCSAFLRIGIRVSIVLFVFSGNPNRCRFFAAPQSLFPLSRHRERCNVGSLHSPYPFPPLWLLCIRGFLIFPFSPWVAQSVSAPMCVSSPSFFVALDVFAALSASPASALFEWCSYSTFLRHNVEEFLNTPNLR